jgi:hypothetical protein
MVCEKPVQISVTSIGSSIYDLTSYVLPVFCAYLRLFGIICGIRRFIEQVTGTFLWYIWLYEDSAPT